MMCMCLHIYMSTTWVLMHTEARRGFWLSWCWSYAVVSCPIWVLALIHLLEKVPCCVTQASCKLMILLSHPPDC